MGRSVPSMRHRTVLAVLLALDLLGLATLHALGDRSWTAWSTSAPPTDAVVALLRFAAIGAGWWIAASTALYAASRMVGAARSAHLLRRLVVPSLRRLVEGALVGSLTLGTAAPATAERAIPPVILIERDTGSDHVGPTRKVPPPLVAPARSGDGRREPEQLTIHVVEPGEHLWAIAAATVGHTGTGEIGRYWRSLVAHNRDRLRSGDPDLVFPGEVIELPPR